MTAANRKFRPFLESELNALFFVALSFFAFGAQVAAAEQMVPWRTSPMRPVTYNSMTVKSCEYWVFEGNVPFRYPDDVTRGFYPPEIAPSTVSCAEQGFDQIVAYLKSDPEELQSAIALGITRSIILSVNDYTLAATDRATRGPKLSHWGLDRDLSQGYWRWEVTLTRDGSCTLPRIQGVREAFRAASRPIKTSHPP